MTNKLATLKPGWLTNNHIAVSMAASWAWGASLVVGITLLLNKGFTTFAIWTAFNIAAIPIFAVGYDKLKYIKQASSYKFFNWPMIVIQMFAIMMNMQAIWQVASGGIALDVPALMSKEAAGFMVAALALVIIGLIYIYEFKGSVVSDQWQYWLSVTFLVSLIVAGLFITGGTFRHIPLHSSHGNIVWAIWGGFGLLAGPYMDAMQWERIEKIEEKDRIKVGLLGGFYFGVYMLLVGVAGWVLSTSLIPVMILLAASFMVDTSTLDSAVSAKQYLFRKNGLGKKSGAIASVLAVCIWPFMSSLGAVTIWSIYAGGRLWVWIMMLIWFGAIVPLKNRVPATG